MERTWPRIILDKEEISISIKPMSSRTRESFLEDINSLALKAYDDWYDLKHNSILSEE